MHAGMQMIFTCFLIWGSHLWAAPSLNFSDPPASLSPHQERYILYLRRKMKRPLGMQRKPSLKLTDYPICLESVEECEDFLRAWKTTMPMSKYSDIINRHYCQGRTFSWDAWVFRDENYLFPLGVQPLKYPLIRVPLTLPNTKAD